MRGSLFFLLFMLLTAPAAKATGILPYGLGPMDGIQYMLKQFHTTACPYPGIPTNKELFAAWDKFIASLPRDAPTLQSAYRAKAVDLAARTVLYESHAPIAGFNFPGEHPREASCEEDVITLSIRNRAANCRGSQYGCNYENDIAGVATKTEYNIWFKSNEGKTWLTTCFLRDDFDPSLFTTLSDKSRARFPQWKLNFESLVKRVPRVLGYDQTNEARASGSYLANLFRVDNVELQAIPSKLQVEALSNMTHYYHPRGMGKCSPRVAKIVNIPGVSWFRIPNQDVMFGSRSPLGGFTFMVKRAGQVFDKGGKDITRKNKLYTPKELYGVDLTIDAGTYSDDEPKTGNDCLPGGVEPDCRDGFETTIPGQMFASGEGETGVPAPRWSTPEDLASRDETLNIERKKPKKPTQGQQVAIACITPEYLSRGKGHKSRSRYPSLGGRCNPTFRPFTGVDGDEPIVDLPTATEEK